MNVLRNLTQAEYDSIVKNGFNDKELFIIKHYRLGDMTLQGMALSMGISEYEARKHKDHAETKIYRLATKVTES